MEEQLEREARVVGGEVGCLGARLGGLPQRSGMSWHFGGQLHVGELPSSVTGHFEDVTWTDFRRGTFGAPRALLIGPAA